MPSPKIEPADIGVVVFVLLFLLILAVTMYGERKQRSRVADCYTQSSPCLCVQGAGTADDYTACRQLELYGRPPVTEPTTEYIYIPVSR